MWNVTILFYFTSTCILRASTRIPFLAEAIEFLTGLDMERKCSQMSFTQEIFDTLVVLILVCVQVFRRLYESLCVSVFSDAKMHVLHYILGIYFYTALGPTALLHLHSAAGECMWCSFKASLGYKVAVLYPLVLLGYSPPLDWSELQEKCILPCLLQNLQYSSAVMNTTSFFSL